MKIIFSITALTAMLTLALGRSRGLPIVDWARPSGPTRSNGADDSASKTRVCGVLPNNSSINPICLQERAIGFCRAAYPRYFYNATSGCCEFFIYGGCGGNNNNFETVEECRATCMPNNTSQPVG
mmetsp:Transcript_18435/g.44039  ORF Transcript_18435/g.44039 Transcript_18435/m.44039 type:complete len:125 (-) Transcript_18435:19-393(-)